MVTLDQAGWNRRMLVLLPPPAPLSHFVELLWIDERPRRSPRPHEWRVVADDATHVIYARSTDERGADRHRLHVVGARRRYADVDCTRRVLTVGARLRPGALPALFRVSADELTDRSVSAECLVRDAARHALMRLEAGTPADLATHLASFVAELTNRAVPPDPRARLLGGMTSGSYAVRAVADAFGISDRALRAWCATHLGLGLRRFLRIRRLHRALEHRLREPSATWSAVAAASGFADQPHLVRDCRALLGEPPGEFLARAG